MSEKEKIKAVKRKERLGKKLAKQLIDASETMIAYYDSCLATGDPVRQVDDTRLLLSKDMRDYGSFMKSIFGE